jgi:DNA transformation protein
MAASAEFLAFLVEQMAGFGPVAARRMFGGAGLYRDGVMFAAVSDDVLYLKTDAEGSNAFAAEGLGPFTYATTGGENTLGSYWRAPARCLDDPDEMALWCRRAFAVALKSAKKRR